MAHRVWVWVFAVCRKRAKFTHVRADIGRVYVAIYVKKYFFAVQFSPFGVCEFTQRKKVQVVQAGAFVRVQTLAALEFFY